MSAPVPVPKSKSESRLQGSDGSTTSESGATPPSGLKTPGLLTSTPGSPLLSPFSSRNNYFSSITPGSYQEDWEFFPPMDRLTVLDILDNLALPQRLEKLQQSASERLALHWLVLVVVLTSAELSSAVSLLRRL